MGLSDRLKHAWNAFQNEEDNLSRPPGDYGASYSIQSYKTRFGIYGDKSIIGSIYTRLGIDVASVEMKHVRLDQNGRFADNVDSGLQNCLTIEANLDQAARAFRQDIAMTLFDKGVIAIVPIETSLDPNNTGSYDIKTLRVGTITQWFPRHVRVELYDERVGLRREITVAKDTVAIVENPLYNVMNEPNGTLQRLIRKLSLLDSVDEQSSSGKLDLIIQLPYVIKSEARREQAEQRRKDIEMQLKGSQYGIAYTDGTERITQLNRPAENNMLKQIEMLTEQLYSQLGLTKEVFDGTADEKTMINYHNRTIEPILSAITEAMKRVFLTKTARTQFQSIEFYRDPFKLVPISSMADIADKFVRNQIFTPNDIRAVVGMRPSSDPKADELRNPNMPDPNAGVPSPVPVTQPSLN